MNLISKLRGKMKKYIICFLLIQISFPQINPGEVNWEESFDNLDNWIIQIGDCSWGWGNTELQEYKSENVQIVEVPEEIGNSAVQITAKQESGEYVDHLKMKVVISIYI